MQETVLVNVSASKGKNWLRELQKEKNTIDVDNNADLQLFEILFDLSNSIGCSYVIFILNYFSSW